MLPAFRHSNLIRWAIGILLAASVASALAYLQAWRRLEAPATDTAAPKGVLPPVGHAADDAVITGSVWQAMSARPGRSEAVTSSMQPNRFRLAGTFSIGDGVVADKRKAIVDDAVNRRQHIVGEGDRIDEVHVATIYHDHVTLQTPTGAQDIWLEFASRSKTAAPTSTVTNEALSAAGSSATNRFGCLKTRENRWEFTRQPLLDYYQELLDEPERLAAVFDTMKPVRDARNKITGYVVGIEGEKAFFDAVGLQQGDIVRSVNSVDMTNRKRAEFFIDEFLKDRMNAVVLEVDRGGQTVKQVYQLRQ